MKISSIYSDGMILQRKKENTISVKNEGTAVVSAMLDDVSLSVSKSGDDESIVTIPAQEAGGPHMITIKSESTEIVIKEVLFGDVYILGGQSNMELPIILTADMHVDEIESADFDKIRQFEVPKVPLFGRKEEFLEGGRWVNADQKNIFGFSAIGFYFAKEKYLQDGVPVGLVQTAVGGAPVESLMSEETLVSTFEEIYPKYKDSGKCNNDKSKCCLWCYKEKLESNRNMDYVTSTQKADLDREIKWRDDLAAKDPGTSGHWENLWDETIGDTVNMPETFMGTKYENIGFGSVWMQRIVDVPEEFCNSRVQLRLGTLIDSDDTYVNGVKVGGIGFKYPPRRYWLSEGILKPGKNVISIRLVMTNGNVGGAVIDTPFCLKKGEKEISLAGDWKVRMGIEADEPLIPQTFFIWGPTALYNSMLYPIRNYNCDAMLFYQGESNGEYPQYYGDLLVKMVEEWRVLFGKDVPFLMAEITMWKGEGPVYEEDVFTDIRNAQKEVVGRIPNTYLIKTEDLGWYNDLHPQNKKEVALRFFDIYKNELK
ncbi:MAG: hypothetical protein IKG93_12465 [Clostridiales bacterium]|nr:hypothetical protein [Clostridiales bacterium]